MLKRLGVNFPKARCHRARKLICLVGIALVLPENSLHHCLLSRSSVALKMESKFSVPAMYRGEGL